MGLQNIWPVFRTGYHPRIRQSDSARIHHDGGITELDGQWGVIEQKGLWCYSRGRLRAEEEGPATESEAIAPQKEL